MDREGTVHVTCSTGPSGVVDSGYALTIDPELEPITLEIVRAMGGTQPSELEREYLFPNSIARGGNGGAIDCALGNKMMTAYRLAQQGYRKSDKL